MVCELHATKLGLLYLHSLLRFTDMTDRFSSSIRSSLILPKGVLRGEAVAALRDCPDCIPFLILLTRHDGQNVYAGVRMREVSQLAATAVL